MEIVGPLSVDDSVKSILCSPDRNEDNTGWTVPEDTIPVSVFNKMKTEDMVRKRKELLTKTVVKKDTVSVTDKCLRDLVRC